MKGEGCWVFEFCPFFAAAAFFTPPPPPVRQSSFSTHSRFFFSVFIASYFPPAKPDRGLALPRSD